MRKPTDEREWRVSVSPTSSHFHVSPTQGLTAVGNWALNPYHHKGLRGFLATFWRTMSGRYYRSEWPKSERALEKAVAECEAWCAGEKAAVQVAQRIAAKYDKADDA